MATAGEKWRGFVCERDTGIRMYRYASSRKSVLVYTLERRYELHTWMTRITTGTTTKTYDCVNDVLLIARGRIERCDQAASGKVISWIVGRWCTVELRKATR